ncbi:LemA family protein [Flavobacterium sp. Root186]|uniref:LemA family protein n=1 Tax=Flavobacterium sp. Root186 TaxID=1736485 RepID=UPI0006F5FCE7|nr:LemA family protein [Flavobacterium sp. Root186]KRB59135.1 hypothetical protein ASD98_22980 [Flavobacterium sp. Root186]
MKKYYLLFFILLNLNCFSQTDIDKSWKSVKDSYIKKTEIVLKLANNLRISKQINKSELDKTVINAGKLKATCDNNVLDKESVNKVKQANGELNSYLVRILVNLESDFKMKSDEKVIDLSGQLAEIEKQIFTNIKRYNNICESLNQKSLIFPTSSYPTEVKF